ncbi:MAG: dTDP-4-dehydrorhamnose 3,5-epimerase family protein, partial [Spirochaetota bacterium]
MPCTFKPCAIPGLIIVEPRLFGDKRGSFMETFKASEFSTAGIEGPFVQDNHSMSSRFTLRGLHYQREPEAQGKL